MHDITQAVKLLRGDEEVVYGAAGYQRIVKKREITSNEAEFRVAVAMQPGKG